MIRAVLLDFYGTIVGEDDRVVTDICEQVRKSTARPQRLNVREIDAHWWQTFQEEAARASKEAFRTHRQIALASLKQTLQHFGSRADAATLCAQQFAYWCQPDLLADARPFLDALEVPVCVVSNIDRADIQAAIDHHQLPLDLIVTSEDARSYKPHPVIFQAALDLLDLPPDQVVHIGDSISADIVGAHTAGVPAVWLNRSRIPHPGQPNPAEEVNNLAAALAVVTSRDQSGAEASVTGLPQAGVDPPQRRFGVRRR